MSIENGRGGWIRTNAWQDQNLLPYRLATPLYPVLLNALSCVSAPGRKWQGRLDSNQRMPGSKPGALPLGDAPITVQLCALKLLRANIHFLTNVSSLRCNIEMLRPWAIKLGNVAGSWRATLSASSWFGKLPNTQAPVPVNLVGTNLFNKIRALRTSE